MMAVALVSGGKDCCFSMMRCIDYGHEIVALANLVPMDDSVDELDSYMYQTVTAMGLNPAKHLGKTLSDMQSHLLQMQELYGINVCGEGGEYETLTLDCPLFRATLHKEVLYMARQLGLDPPTMPLCSGGAAVEMEQALENCETVAQCFKDEADSIIGGLSTPTGMIVAARYILSMERYAHPWFLLRKTQQRAFALKLIQAFT